MKLYMIVGTLCKKIGIDWKIINYHNWILEKSCKARVWYREFSYDVMAATLVYQDKITLNIFFWKVHQHRKARQFFCFKNVLYGV